MILILSFCGQLIAQQRDTIQKKIIMPENPEISSRHPGMQISSGSAFVPVLSQDFNSGLDLSGSIPFMNLNLENSWKTQMGSLSGLRFLTGFPLAGNSIGLYRRSVWDIYQGEYGVRTFQVNNKLYVGTALYSEKSFNDYEQKSGFYRQTNYSSSVFIGYKFSEKFSISAGFTIQRNGDPLNRYQGIQSGGMFP
jgi:hypothetical protein